MRVLPNGIHRLLKSGRVSGGVDGRPVAAASREDRCGRGYRCQPEYWIDGRSVHYDVCLASTREWSNNVRAGNSSVLIVGISSVVAPRIFAGICLKAIQLTGQGHLRGVNMPCWLMWTLEQAPA
jgi:hypothetical protein